MNDSEHTRLAMISMVKCLVVETHKIRQKGPSGNVHP